MIKKILSINSGQIKNVSGKLIGQFNIFEWAIEKAEKVGNVKFTFKLDTGAEFNVLARHLVEKTKASLKACRTRNLISYTVTDR